MTIETVITNAWNSKAKWLYLLSPLSWLYAGVISIRKFLYKYHLIKSYQAPIPVMVIGNITVGGSGKTPLIISLINYLHSLNIEVGIISRGYGGDSSKMPCLVKLDSTPDVVGDEPCLIVQSTAKNNQVVPMAVSANRQQAIELLLHQHPNLKLIISDDGLQHYKLQRDFEWIVVDSHRGFGNKKLLPVGFLREPISRLKDATVVYHETHQTPKSAKRGDSTHALSMRLNPAPLIPLLLTNINSNAPEPSSDKNPHTVNAISGIGYPTRFFMTLRKLGFEVNEYPFSDHHDFSFDDLQPFVTDITPIIVTSKDAVKLRELAHSLNDSISNHIQLSELFSRIWVLPVTAELSNACYQELNNVIRMVEEI